MVLDTDSIKKPELMGKFFLEELTAMKKEFKVIQMVPQ